MCMVWHPRCRQAAPGLLQTTMQISGQLEWPTMSNMQNDCFGMNGLLWQYHHDHILKGRFFGRVDVCECAWCDCFFRYCMFCGWGGPRRWPVAHPDSNFLFRDYGTYELLFSSRCDFCLRTSRQCQETESRFTERIGNTNNMPMSGNRISIHGMNRKHEQYLRVRSGEVVFYTIMHFVVLQRCAPSFAQNWFVMYITHVHRYVCYVFHFVMYIIDIAHVL